jgi:fructosamine-3-kinase
MLTNEQMKRQIKEYQITFDLDTKEAYITKGAGQTQWVKVSNSRALQWIHAGIDDLDARDKADMIELINQWIEENKKEI